MMLPHLKFLPLRNECIQYLRILQHLGFDDAYSASISIRTDDPKVILFCSSSYFSGELAAELVGVHLLEGDKPEPGKPVGDDLSLHTAVYLARQDAQAIIHAQPHHATAFAAAGQSPNPAVTQETLLGLDDIALCTYHPRRTFGLSDCVTEALGGYSRAVLIRGLGALTLGENLNEAFRAMRLLEMASKVTVLTNALGCKEPGLTPDEQRAAWEV